MAPGAFSTIYWPIETKVRELDSALLFAVLGAQRGWSVIVGGKSEIYARLKQNAEPGIVVDKSIQKGSERLFIPLKKAGHRVFARCEEALWSVTPEQYANLKTGVDAFREVEVLLAWGRRHAGFLAHVYPQFAHKVVATGNIRFDVMNPAVRGIYEREVSRIRQKWGSFYLLNTKLTKINDVKAGIDYLESQKAKGRIPNEEQLRLILKRLALEKETLPHYIEFVERFSKELPGETLIIRPHPAEDFSLWHRLAAGKTNVHVIHEGSVYPWLLASKMSISSDCTTSVEAFLLDKPGINFRPYQDEEVEGELPRVTAYQIETTDALLAALASSDPSSTLSLPDVCVDEILGNAVAQYPRGFASHAILDFIEDLRVTREGLDDPGYNPLRKRNHALAGMRTLKVLVAWCISKKNRARYRNREHKFRGLELGEVATRVDDICGTLGYEGIRVKQVADNIFHIDRET